MRARFLVVQRNRGPVSLLALPWRPLRESPRLLWTEKRCDFQLRLHEPGNWHRSTLPCPATPFPFPWHPPLLLQHRHSQFQASEPLNKTSSQQAKTTNKVLLRLLAVDQQSNPTSDSAANFKRHFPLPPPCALDFPVHLHLRRRVKVSSSVDHKITRSKTQAFGSSLRDLKFIQDPSSSNRRLPHDLLLALEAGLAQSEKHSRIRLRDTLSHITARSVDFARAIRYRSLVYAGLH